jgi:hypothetical protein
VEKAKFYGAIVSSPWVRGSFWDRVDVSRESIHLRPWMRTNILLDRARVEYVGFEKDWRPLTWATNVRFHLVGGGTATKIFVPARTRALRDAIEELGWPTQDETVR